MSNKEDKQANLIGDIRSLVASSLGRLPTSLVVILTVALVLALLSGVMLEWMRPDPKQSIFMPLRIDADQSIKIDSRKIWANWVYQTPEFAMTLTLTGDERFEWIVVFADLPGDQYYARGSYRISGDVMVLGVRTDLGKPYDPEKPWLKILPLAMKDLNTKVELKSGDMIWTVPLSEQEKLFGSAARIFVDHEDGRFIWGKM